MKNDFAQYVRILGRGKKASRTLTTEEAHHAMTLMLSGEYKDVQLGAFWMLIRIREETVEETVGFTQATRELLAKKTQLDTPIDLDWPSYAGKRSELPWYLLSALALANYGIKTVMHGHAFDEEERMFVDETIQALGLPISHNVTDINQAIADTAFAYIPLVDIDSTLSDMMDLKYYLGLRSPVNTIVRMMNPFQATHSVHGVYHKGYDTIHVEASEQLQDNSVLVFRGGNGEAEINPERDITLLKWQKGVSSSASWLRAATERKRIKNNFDISRMTAYWRGEESDPFGELAVKQTLASVAGLIYGEESQAVCLQLAEDIWAKRDKSWI